MPYYDGTDFSEQIYPVKSSNSKECMLCHYRFSNDWFQFQNFVCNGFYDLKMFCFNIGNFTIITVKDFDYCCIFYDISKSEAAHLLENHIADCGDWIRKTKN